MSVRDETLTILHRHGPEYGPYGFSNHGPMAAEALTALDRADAVLPLGRATPNPSAGYRPRSPASRPASGATPWAGARRVRLRQVVAGRRAASPTS